MNSDDHDVQDEESAAERRRYERFATSLSVDYASGETFLFAYLKDISEMGIFIRTDTPQEIGTNLRLRFQPEGQEPLVLEGKVIWINPYRERGDNLNPGMGVRFKKLTPELREKVVELVRTIAYLREGETNEDA
jgi:type IV pilus assembly protein PilZ